jgi:putative membrane protein
MKHKHTLGVVAALFAASLAGAAQAQTSPSTTTAPATQRETLDRADSSFLKDVAEANYAEIEAAKVAQSKAKSADVKSFASQMIDDHTKAQQEVQKLADSKGVKLPDGPSLGQKARLKLLESGDADKFDARYAENFGMKAHEDTVKMFEKHAGKAKDADVKAFIDKTLPTLKHHQTMASSLEASVAPTAAGRKSESKTEMPTGTASAPAK